MTSIKLIDCPPIGVRHGLACYSHGGIREVSMPTYELSPFGDYVQAMRMKHDRTLRETADELGLKPSELSALERGAAKPATDEDWKRICAVLSAPKVQS